MKKEWYVVFVIGPSLTKKLLVDGKANVGVLVACEIGRLNEHDRAYMNRWLEDDDRRMVSVKTEHCCIVAHPVYEQGA